MIDFGFRVDVDSIVGSGHIYRCLSLAKVLVNNKKKVIFFISNKEKFLAHTNNFPYLELIGKNEHEKISKIKNMNNISNILVDLPKKNSMYSRYLPHNKTIILDDIGKKTIYSKILINFQIAKQFHRYKINQNETKTYFGKKYIIINDNILFKKQKKINLNKNIKKILISISTVYLKSNIIKQFEKLIKNSEYSFTILLRPGINNTRLFSNIQNIKNTKIIISSKNPRSAYLENDLVITHAGMTTYELAYLGIPSVMIFFNNNQKILADEFEKNGYGLKIGYSKNICNKLPFIIRKLEDLENRTKMSKSGQKLIDGKGIKRIYRLLIND